MTLQDSVKMTKAYARHFGSQLSPLEVHQWLISPKRYSKSKVNSVTTKQFAKNNLKNKSHKISLDKISSARKLVEKIKNFPFICFVGITGSVSANNAKMGDDIDIFIITKKDALWIVRPFFLMYVSLFFRRRKRKDPHTAVKDMFCFNLWLDESALRLKKENRNLYTAHEVLQVLPILNKNGTYEKFIKKNSWAKTHLANAYHQVIGSPNFKLNSKKYQIDKTNFVINTLNFLFYFLQRVYMYPYQTTEKATLHSAFLHTVNHHDQIRKTLGSL